MSPRTRAAALAAAAATILAGLATVIAPAPATAATPTAARAHWSVGKTIKTAGTDTLVRYGWSSKASSRYKAAEPEGIVVSALVPLEKVVVRFYPKGTDAKRSWRVTFKCKPGVTCTTFQTGLSKGRANLAKDAAIRTDVYPVNSKHVAGTARLKNGTRTDQTTTARTATPAALATPAAAARHPWRADGVTQLQGHDVVMFVDWTARGTSRYKAAEPKRLILSSPVALNRVVVKFYPKGTDHKGFRAGGAECVKDDPCTFYDVDMPLAGKRTDYAKNAAARVYAWPADGGARTVKTVRLADGYRTDADA